jgi:catabolite regulation protein CreA
MMAVSKLTCVLALLVLAACGSDDREVGEFSNDLLGNEIMIEARHDPAIPNVVCHMAYFDRSVLDRLRQGNRFENPSNSAVSCQRIGPVSLAGVPLTRAGEEIFHCRGGGYTSKSRFGFNPRSANRETSHVRALPPRGKFPK